MREATGVQRSFNEFAGRLSACRVARGWTLDELAERSGLSKAQLSRLESAQRQPSLAALLSLAQAYGMSVGALFENPQADQDVHVVRAGQGVPQQANGLAYWPLSAGGSRFNLQPICVVVSPHRTGTERYSHDGEEWLMVLSGRLHLDVGRREHTLQQGDSAHFNSQIPHRLTALDGADARILVVACALAPQARAVAPRPAGQRVTN